MIRFQRIQDRPRHRSPRRQMNHVLHSLARRLHRGQISNRPNMEINLVAHRRQIRFLARGKIVQHHHFLPAFDELIHNVRADKSRAARHQITHSENPPAERQRNEWSHIFQVRLTISSPLADEQPPAPE